MSNMVDGSQLRSFLERIEVEEWRVVKAFPDYAVSSYGRVKCVRRRRYLKAGDLIALHILRNGYVVGLLDGKNRLIHRIVCAAFHGDAPSPLHEAAHNDGVRDNNWKGNVRWATHKENCADKKSHGTNVGPRGEMQGKSKLRAADVTIIRERLASGDGVMSISRDFGVSHGAIGLIKSGRNWSHV